MDDVKYKGGCACGAIKLELAAEPAGPYQCYCQQCQAACGGSAAIFVMLPLAAMHITQGKPVGHDQVTTSGRKASRFFCADCGTQVYSTPHSSAGMAAVKLGVIEKAPWASIKAVFWTSEAPAWALIDPNAKRFETQ